MCNLQLYTMHAQILTRVHSTDQPSHQSNEWNQKWKLNMFVVGNSKNKMQNFNTTTVALQLQEICP